MTLLLITTTQKKMAYIYFIFQENIPNKCKIGYTTDCPSRLSGLNVGNPDELDIYHYIKTSKENGRPLEKYIHSLVKGLNIKGEWFMLSKKTVDHLILSTDFEKLDLKPKIKITKNLPLDVNRKRWKCDLCNFEFSTNSNYNKHKKKKSSCLSNEQVYKMQTKIKKQKEKLEDKDIKIKNLSEENEIKTQNLRNFLFAQYQKVSAEYQKVSAEYQKALGFLL